MEYWDLLDDDRRMTGETLLRGEPLPEGRFHTIIGVWTIHDELKRVLLTKRAPEKLICPNQWENTGGSLVSGEESRPGAAREVREETGLKICTISRPSASHRPLWIATFTTPPSLPTASSCRKAKPWIGSGQP